VRAILEVSGNLGPGDRVASSQRIDLYLLAVLCVSPLRLIRAVKTAHRGYEGGTAVSGRYRWLEVGQR